jgi:hypothetical protein
VPFALCDLAAAVFLPRKQEVARYEMGVKVGKAESTGGGLVRPCPIHEAAP